MFDFSIVTNWIHQMLTSFMPEGLAVFLECVVIGVCIILMYAVLAIILIYMERKICAFFQCRLGPMRVGKWGLLQVPCDVIKMLTKEIIDLKFSDRFLYNLAPFMVIIASFLTFACLPISKGLEVLDFNVGVFFLACRFKYRRGRYPACRLEFQQQVLAYRSHAKRRANHQLRTFLRAEYPDNGSPDGHDAVLRNRSRDKPTAGLYSKGTSRQL